MRPAHCDVVVVGAGPAGCATAIALLQAGVERVCVLEAASATGPQVGETMPPDTRAVLAELGAWEAFLADGHLRCLGSCAAWGGPELGYNDALMSPLGPGWHLDRRRFDETLRRRAREAGAVFLRVGRNWACRPASTGGAVELATPGEHGAVLSSPWVVDATGARARLAHSLGARHTVLDRLTLTYGFFEAGPEAAALRLTMAEASEDGWWYAAGLPQRRVAVAFATDPAIGRQARLRDPRRWFARLLETRHLAPRLAGAAFIASSLTVRTAPVAYLAQPCGPGWVAVGDAAVAHDPMASEGIHHALETGLAAGRAIAAALRSGRPLDPAYAHKVLAGAREHAALRAHLYGLEGRWAEAPFWRNRRGAPATAAGPAEARSRAASR